ncbi:hypothetical protein FKP32DRAFT_1583248 [Trametes sanguinea]|nr:hypothetical protein FKP32DRAFT_1583248 [Trametes sanguinea]
MASSLPPAPKIDGEAMLEVFVHRSMKFSGAPLNSDSPYGDGARLAALGSKVLEAVYTDVLFNQRPMLPADELRVGKLQDKVNEWVEGYRWRDKVRCTPETKLDAPEETRLLFDSYVGAVFVGGGYKAVRDWIGALVGEATPPAQQGLYAEPEYKRPKVETGYGMGGYASPQPNPFPAPHALPVYGHPPPPGLPPPPAIPPPPLPANPLAPAQPHSAFLPLFNQTAQQRRLEVQYPAQFSGPAHAGRWTVQCLVNGIEKGIGTGSSKQLAKEEAARQAYHAMGWAPRKLEIGHIVCLQCVVSNEYHRRLTHGPRIVPVPMFGGWHTSMQSQRFGSCSTCPKSSLWRSPVASQARLWPCRTWTG